MPLPHRCLFRLALLSAGLYKLLKVVYFPLRPPGRVLAVADADADALLGLTKPTGVSQPTSGQQKELPSAPRGKKMTHHTDDVALSSWPRKCECRWLTISRRRCSSSALAPGSASGRGPAAAGRLRSIRASNTTS